MGELEVLDSDDDDDDDLETGIDEEEGLGAEVEADWIYFCVALAVSSIFVAL